MGFLSNVAQQIKKHITTRYENPQLWAKLYEECARQRREFDEVERWLRGNEFWLTGVPVKDVHRQIGEGTHPCPHVLVCAKLDDYQSPEGRIAWREAWSYPSADLLMYRDRFDPYDPTLSTRLAYPHQRRLRPPLLWDVVLQVAMCTSGNLSTTCEQTRTQPLGFFVVIPLAYRSWLEPRAVARQLKPFAPKKRYRSQKAFEEPFLADFRQPDRDTGQPNWRMHVTPETPPAAVLTQLAIGAWHVGFPVGEGDEHAALMWIRGVIQQALRRLALDNDTRQRWDRDLPGIVLQRLIDRFDLPPSSLAFHVLIQRTVRGIVRDEWKKGSSGNMAEPQFDSASGARLYPDAYVAKDVGVSAKMVARWRKARGITREGLLERQLIDFRRECDRKREVKRQRKWLREKGVALGMAQATVEQAIYRGEKEGRCWEAIEATLERNAAKQKRREAEATAPFEDAISLEELCVSLQARLHEAQTEDERIEVLDKLQHLRQLQESSQP